MGDVSDINTRILEIFGDKEFDQEKFEAESERIVKFREEITKLRKQVIEDMDSLDKEFNELKDKVKNADILENFENLNDDEIYYSLKLKTEELVEESQELSEEIQKKFTGITLKSKAEESMDENDDLTGEI